jgi:hypothetical protein
MKKLVGLTIWGAVLAGLGAFFALVASPAVYLIVRAVKLAWDR